MSTLLTPERELTQVLRELPAARARVTISDRISMRIGLWLILHSSRPVVSHDEQARVHRNEHDRLAREAAHAAAASYRLI